MKIIKCPQCGSKINEKMKMCIKCGHILESFQEENENHRVVKQNEKKRYFHRYLIIGIIILGLLGFIGYRIYIEQQKELWITPLSKIVVNQDSIHYVNDLYKSDDRAYHHMLSKKERTLYDQLFKAITTFSSTFVVNTKEYDFLSLFEAKQGIGKAKIALLMDHPELIQFGYITVEEIDSNTVKVSVKYALDQKEYPIVLEQIHEIIEEIKKATHGKTDYEKAKYIYEWLVQNNVYGNADNPKCYSAYSALIRGSTVDLGLTRASQLLFQNVGILSLSISGSFDQKDREWNYVSIDNAYYDFDASVGIQAKDIAQNEIVYTGFFFENDLGYQKNYQKMVSNKKGKKHYYYRKEKLLFTYGKKTGEQLKPFFETDKKIIQIEFTNMQTVRSHIYELQTSLGFKGVHYNRNVVIFDMIDSES